MLCQALCQLPITNLAQVMPLQCQGVEVVRIFPRKLDVREDPLEGGRIDREQVGILRGRCSARVTPIEPEDLLAEKVSLLDCYRRAVDGQGFQVTDAAKRKEVC